jgi:hypothetical protein
MARNASFAQYRGIDSDAVVAESDAESEDAEMNFNLDSAGMSVAMCVENCLAASLFELLLYDSVEVATPSAHNRLELRRTQGSELSSDGGVSLGQSFRFYALGPEARKHTSPLDHDAVRLT